MQKEDKIYEISQNKVFWAALRCVIIQKLVKINNTQGLPFNVIPCTLKNAIKYDTKMKANKNSSLAWGYPPS